jgi:hypothetical protein
MDPNEKKETPKRSAKKKKKKKRSRPTQESIDPTKFQKVSTSQYKRKDGRADNKGRSSQISTSTITKHIRRTLKKDFPDAEGKPTGQTYMQKLVENAILLAISGDFKFFKEIIDRIDGPIPDFPMDEDGEGVSSSVVVTIE